MVRAVLVAYLATCTYLILLLQGLSVIRQIAFGPVAAGVMVGLGIGAWLVWRRRGAFRPRTAWRALVRAETLPFLVVLPPLLVLLLAQGWHFPQSSWDSMTYHLARAAYWRQWHSLAHFIANNPHQTAFPGNVELLYTVQMVLAPTARATYLVGFVGYLIAGLAIYGVGRQVGATAPFALLGAGLFATFPETVLQSTSTAIDLVVAAFLLCAVYFFLDLLRTGRASSLIMLGAAVGLMVGAKPTPLLALPGLLIEGALLTATWGEPLRRKGRGLLVPAAGALCLAALLALPWYVENLLDYGTLSGPGVIAEEQLVAKPTLRTFTINLGRHLIALIDPDGPAMIEGSLGQAVCEHVGDGRAWLAAVTGVGKADPAVEFHDTTYDSAPQCDFYQTTAWFGFTGCLVVYLALGLALVSLARRGQSPIWLCVAGAESYLLCACLLLRWQPWEGRLLTPLVALCCPVAAIVLERMAVRRAGVWAICLLAIYGAIGAPVAAVLNTEQSLADWNQGYFAQITRTDEPLRPVLQAVESMVPRAARLGIMLPYNDWEFPFFGQDLSRTLVPIKLPAKGYLSFTAGPVFRYAVPFDYLLTNVSARTAGAFFAATPAIRCTALWAAALPRMGAWRLFHCSSPGM